MINRRTVVMVSWYVHIKMYLFLSLKRMHQLYLTNLISENEKWPLVWTGRKWDENWWSVENKPFLPWREKRMTLPSHQAGEENGRVGGTAQAQSRKERLADDFQYCPRCSTNENCVLPTHWSGLRSERWYTHCSIVFCEIQGSWTWMTPKEPHLCVDLPHSALEWDFEFTL